MTMPHLMNCEHCDEGWCQDCVRLEVASINTLKKKYHDEYTKNFLELQKDLENIRKLCKHTNMIRTIVGFKCYDCGAS